MKTDRELLELAAKADGYVLTDGSQGYRTFRCKGGVEWNPLTDDGDALRLAAKLGMDIWRGKWPSGGRYVAAHRVWNSNDSMYYDDGVSLTPDPLAATRRAIVRAAAAIGESKQ